MGGAESLRAFQRVGIGNEAARDQRCRLDPIGGGEAGVEGFAHGAELRFQPRGAGGEQAQHHGAALCIQTHQTGGGHACAKGSGGGGLVKAGLIVVAPQPDTDADRRLDPDQGGGLQVGAADAPRLGHG